MPALVTRLPHSASSWLSALLPLLTVAQPRERAAGLEIQVCEDVPSAPPSPTALEDRPVSLVTQDAF